MDSAEDSKLIEAVEEAKKNVGILKNYKVSTRSGNERLKAFKIEKIIGRGTFGIVSKVVYSDGGLGAIKTTYQDCRYWNRELETLLGLNHRNIIKLEYYFTAHPTRSGHYLNLLFEYCPYTLEDIIKLDCVGENTIKDFYKQTVSGLDYLHSMNICHRDIKPQNIALTSSGIVKILDFGSAKILSNKKESISYICARFYRAPENLMDYKKYSTKIDLWSVGCVFCEFKTSTPIFLGKNAGEILDQIFNCIGTDQDLFKMCSYTTVKEYPKRDFIKYLRSLFKDIKLVEVIYKSLKLDPFKRISASEILRSGLLDI